MHDEIIEALLFLNGCVCLQEGNRYSPKNAEHVDKFRGTACKTTNQTVLNRSSDCIPLLNVSDADKMRV